MNNNTAAPDKPFEVPADVLSSPALLFLYYRIEQILGIRAGYESLNNLNNYMEKSCGSSFIENPAAYEYLLTSREQIYNISKFLTVNETYFFREGAHFKLLADLLPELAKLKRPIHICSAATSIGCEAYSLAMLFDYHIKNGLELDFAVDAFDVSNEAIETAKIARYTANSLRNDGVDWKYILDKYLIHDNGEYIVPQNIRRKVRFFPHNIMRGLEGHYDIIFFRNALIYFSSKNRLAVLNNLSDSLFNNGLLFLGISETSSVNHPLLANRYSSDVFYFQKIELPVTLPRLDCTQKEIPAKGKKTKYPQKPVMEKALSFPGVVKQTGLHISCAEITDILKTEEGKSNAENIFEKIIDKNTDSLSGSSIAAAVIYYLHTQDFERADKILGFLEIHNSCACAKFLRGEYHFLHNNFEDAQKFYQETAVKDKFFWPAFYKIAVLASEGNQTRHEYKIKKAIESIELLQNQQADKKHNYECFMGGFSSDYFLRILEKKLIKTEEVI